MHVHIQAKLVTQLASLHLFRSHAFTVRRRGRLSRGASDSPWPAMFGLRPRPPRNSHPLPCISTGHFIY